jgi:hypothetical protein
MAGKPEGLNAELQEIQRCFELHSLPEAANNNLKIGLAIPTL